MLRLPQAKVSRIALSRRDQFLLPYIMFLSKVLTVSLSEKIIQQTIERNILRRDKNGTLPKANWEGMSSALLASKPIPSMFDLTIGQNTINGLQRKS